MREILTVYIYIFGEAKNKPSSFLSFISGKDYSKEKKYCNGRKLDLQEFYNGQIFNIPCCIMAKNIIFMTFLFHIWNYVGNFNILISQLNTTLANILRTFIESYCKMLVIPDYIHQKSISGHYYLVFHEKSRYMKYDVQD